MRLDRYLKVSRLIKRRTVAKEIIDQGRIDVNDNTAKPSTNVQVGDLIEIRYGNRTMTVKVTELQESTKKADADNMYELISNEYREDDSETI